MASILVIVESIECGPRKKKHLQIESASPLKSNLSQTVVREESPPSVDGPQA